MQAAPDMTAILIPAYFFFVCCLATHLVGPPHHEVGEGSDPADRPEKREREELFRRLQKPDEKTQKKEKEIQREREKRREREDNYHEMTHKVAG